MPTHSPVPLRRFRCDVRHDGLKRPRGKEQKHGRRVVQGRFFTSRAKDGRGCDAAALCLSPRAPPTGRSGVVTTTLRCCGLADLASRWAEAKNQLCQRRRRRSEGLHGEAKALARAVRRGLDNRRIQAFPTAAAINLKRLTGAVLAFLWQLEVLLPAASHEPPRIRRRPQLSRGWGEEDVEPLFAWVRQRAVRMVLEHSGDRASPWAVIGAIAAKIGCAAETSRKRVWQAERDQGLRAGPTAAEQERTKVSERENRGLCQSDEILGRHQPASPRRSSTADRSHRRQRRRSGSATKPVPMAPAGIAFTDDHRGSHGLAPICKLLPIPPDLPRPCRAAC